MKVVFFSRKPFPHQFSIERVFDGISQELKKDATLQVETKVMPYFSTGILPRLKNIWWARKHQGDINHITGDVHYLALGLPGRNTVLTIHDLNFLNHPHPVARWLLNFFWMTLPLKKVRYITLISEATREDLLRRFDFPEKRIRVIPNYYDATFFRVPKEFNAAQPRILQIGTKANKNVPRLIEALEGISCHLVIIGAESQSVREALQRFHISFTWMQRLTDDQLKEQYALCDIVSFVSTIEGFGMPILEAQAMGRAVITSNISSMPEVGGEGAHYVDPFDVKDIQTGIRKVIHENHYRSLLIEKGFVNVKRFELHEAVSLYRNLYYEVYSNTYLKDAKEM